jgi:hypothetical protein
MKNIIYILFLLTLLASCSKYDLLQPVNNGADNGNPYGITDPDKDGDHDADPRGITDPDKDGDHDKDSSKNIGT